MAHEGLHEPFELLPDNVKDFHRMIQSTMEELEAVDWYYQRAVMASDPAARDIMMHNRDEEIEHACMGLEWLRRNDPVWDEMLRTFLFTQGPITEVEEGMGDEGGDSKPAGQSTGDSLGIGKL